MDTIFEVLKITLSEAKKDLQRNESEQQFIQYKMALLQKDGKYFKKRVEEIEKQLEQFTK